MHEIVADACNALNELADNIQQQAKNQQPEVPMSQHKGWHHPSITPNEVEQVARDLATKLGEANIENIDGLDKGAITQIPTRLQLLQKQGNIQHMFNGHGHQAIPSYLMTIKWVEGLFDPALSYGTLDNPLIPNALKKKVRSIQSRVDNLDIKKDKLEEIISQIESAHAAAESLPSDLADLQEARNQLAAAVTSSKSDIEKAIEVEKSALISTTSSANTKLENIEALLQKADKRSAVLAEQTETARNLLEDSEKAYSIAVTKGLSGAFHTRASNLSWSMWFWVAGLVGALFFGVETGSDRIETLSTLMTAKNPNIELILIQLFLSILNLGAPIWFAWLSTKQISQRFRLAEDYNYKASVAKAYEAYRKEAARIDPILEAKLMHSTISRLDEAPLRHVDDTYHSTPWQELIASTEFRQAVNSIPELKNRFSEIINKSLPDSLKPKSEN
ncbi:hypothetical protein [Oceanicoccus sagamiensis]|uniref:Uncharacterized protein n=1 Tax=Oceanicoccus sagamiensis TaxID=716816 RepID=A0A1X9N8F8_9GAMM|nr:hypothetical protein [Oceanicoccus sagamiensis]ARN74340.1 hypothetical protein BST96_09510 [Oceanicoccus sagamiensis]